METPSSIPNKIPPPTPKRRPSEAPKKNEGTERSETRERLPLAMGFATEVSPDHPLTNEDNFVGSTERAVAGLMDGMGGMPAGEKASGIAGTLLSKDGLKFLVENAVTEGEVFSSKLCQKIFGADRNTPLSEDEVETAMELMLNYMNTYVERIGDLKEVQERAEKYFEEKMRHKYDPADEMDAYLMKKVLQSVACTASVMKIWKDQEGKNKVTVGQAGDSRIYCLRGGFQLEQLTRDDSHVQILLENGLIDGDQDVTQVVTIDSIRNLAQKDARLKSILPKLAIIEKESQTNIVTIQQIRNNVTQGIGLGTITEELTGASFNPQIKTYDVAPGDTLLLVSDGISDNLTDDEILSVLALYQKNPEMAAKKLVEMASKVSKDTNNPRNKPDDLTAGVFAVG